MKTALNKQKGVALLYVMGILALLMVMALAFMNSSIFDMRVAANSASGSLSEQLAQSTIENVVWALKNNPAIFGTDPIFYSWMPPDHYRDKAGISHSSNYISRDGLEALDTYDFVGGTKIYTFNYNDNKNKTIVDRVRWIQFTSASGEVNSKQVRPVIGRAAFLVIQLGQGQINPKDIVVDKIDELASTRPEKRRGVHLNEINIRDIDSMFSSSNAGFVNYSGTGTGKMQGGAWVDKTEFITDMVSALSLSGKQLENANELVDKLFVFNNAEENERFMIQHSDLTDKINLHRFYLPGFINQQDDVEPKNNEIADGNELTEPKWNRWESSDPLTYVDKYLLLNPNSSGGPQLDIREKGKWLDINDSANSAQTTYDPGKTGKIPLVSDLPAGVEPEENMGSYGVGLPWLALFGYDKTGNFVNDDAVLRGTFDSVLARRRQIAANLKDYCDNDNIPTSNITPASWSLTTKPEYTGNERTPYINKFEFQLTFRHEYSLEKSGNPEKFYVKSKVLLSLDCIGAEVIDIYNCGVDTDVSDAVVVDLGIALDSSSKIGISVDETTEGKKEQSLSGLSDGKISFSGAGNWHKKTTNETTEQIIVTNHFYNEPTNKSILDGSSGGMISVEIANKSYDSQTDVPGSIKLSGTVKLNLGNAILKYGGNNVDYSEIQKTIEFDFTETVTMPGVGGSDVCDKKYTFTVETEDPRQNLNSRDWYIYPDPEDKSIAINSSTTSRDLKLLGYRNQKSNPSAPENTDDGYDKEVVTHPGYEDKASGKFLSTAYIRNAPMLSPWELGFIHRGKKWQTLNIHTYDEDKATTAIKVTDGANTRYYPQGGGRYDFGDANILDQIKMTPGITSFRKINVVAAEQEIWNGLLKIDTLKNKEYIEYSSTSRQDIDGILGSSSFNFISNTYNHIKTNAASMTTRAAIAKSVDLQNAGETKAAQEEMIGKIINLTDVYTGIQSFEMIVVAQAIKDIGSTTSTALAIKKYYYVDGKLSSNPIEIESHMGEINYGTTPDGQTIIADEILSQKKYRVSGYLDSTGGVQINNIRIVE